MPMIARPIQVTRNTDGHGEDLRDQPALQRFADAIDDDGGAGAMPRRGHEQQPFR